MGRVIDVRICTDFRELARVDLAVDVDGPFE